MPRATIISLPADQPPVFPDACVACGTASPRRRARVPLVNGAEDGAGFKDQNIEAPFCGRCERALDWYYWWRLGVVALFLGALFTGLGPWRFAVFFSPTLEALRRQSPWLPGAFVVGSYCLLTGCGLALVWLWSYWSPPSFVPTWRPGVIDYRFRDANQAAAFARTNQTLDTRTQ